MCVCVCLSFRVWVCGCPEMESYEEFCLRSLAILQEGGQFKKKTCEPLWALKACSVIRFHGRAVLSPLVRKKQTDMRNYPKGLTQAIVNGCFKRFAYDLISRASIFICNFVMTKCLVGFLWRVCHCPAVCISAP